MRRSRRARIPAAVGPASATRERIRALADAGADAFRLDFRQGSHADHAERYPVIAGIASAHIGGTPLPSMVQIPEHAQTFHCGEC